MSEDKPAKANGLSTDPMQRLASFKAPRDLSLGGAKPSNKKVFTPNLNVSRNKNKGPVVPNLRDNKKDDKNRRDRQRDRNKNFNRNGPNLIKSSGVFSEGIGSAERQPSRVSFGKSSEPAPVLQKPTIRVRDFVKIDKEQEDKKIKAITSLGGAGEDEEESVDFKKLSEKDAPIQLPMDDGSWLKVKPTVNIKQEPVIKEELEDDLISLEELTMKPPPEVKKETFEDTDVFQLLKNPEPTLILLQLPDSLPGRGGAPDDGRRPRAEAEPSTSEEKDDKPADPRCKLSDLEEGRIGKLLLHRSGRVSLAVGNTVFEVSMGTKAAFHQEVVSVAADDGSRSANIVSLGALQHKLSVMPHWETLLQDLPV